MQKNMILLIFTAGSIMALVIRIALINGISNDMVVSMQPWADHIKKLGFIQAFKSAFYDYTPLYLYGISIITALPIPAMIAIKMLSILFDFIGAFYIYKILKELYGKGSILPAIGYVSFLFIPTVVVNSSYWGQCDIIFTTFIIISIYFFLKNKMLSSILSYAVALSIKLQAVFIFPLFILFWLKKYLKTWHFLFLPGVYILTIIPAALAGRPLSSLFWIYGNQISEYKYDIKMGLPNIYQWSDYRWFFNRDLYDLILISGIIFTGLLVFAWLARKWKDGGLEKEKSIVIEYAYTLSVIIPFFLPRMHERYFYVADALGLLYLFYKPRNFYLPVIIWAASFLCYLSPLGGPKLMNYEFLTFGVFIAVIKLLYDNFKKLPVIGENNEAA
jgi:Gpi18-like mannosyltransferase